MSALSKEWRDAMHAVLKPAGFSGRGNTWNRRRPPFVDCVNLQLRTDQTKYCVNLALHLDFLPKRTDGPLLQSSECEIMTRLAMQGTSDHWWIREDAKQRHQMTACLADHGLRFFERYNELPGPFVGVGPENLEDDWVRELMPSITANRKRLLLARIHEHVGNGDEATMWAQLGLENIGRGVALKPAFRSIIKRFE